jgi:GNAT superfamily N-acetyltransferase
MFLELRRWNPEHLDRHDRVYRQWARSRLLDGTLRAYVVDAPDGSIAGSGAVWLAPQQPRPHPGARLVQPYILSMYTERRARGRGVASRIVTEMVRWAADEGYPRIFLHASKLGRPVYARLGFVEGNEMRLDLSSRRRASSSRTTSTRSQRRTADRTTPSASYGHQTPRSRPR